MYVPRGDRPALDQPHLPLRNQDTNDAALEVGKGKRNLVDRFFQSFTGFEAWLLGSWDFQSLTGLWVAAGTSRAISYGESAEANQYNRVASLQSASDGFDYCVQRTASSSFRDVSGCGDSINQFRLVHSKSPYIYLY